MKKLIIGTIFLFSFFLLPTTTKADYDDAGYLVGARIDQVFYFKNENSVYRCKDNSNPAPSTSPDGSSSSVCDPKVWSGDAGLAFRSILATMTLTPREDIKLRMFLEMDGDVSYGREDKTVTTPRYGSKTCRKLHTFTHSVKGSEIKGGKMTDSCAEPRESSTNNIPEVPVNQSIGTFKATWQSANNPLVEDFSVTESSRSQLVINGVPGKNYTIKVGATVQKKIYNEKTRLFEDKTVPCSSFTIAGKKPDSSCKVTLSAKGPIATFDVTPKAEGYYSYSLDSSELQEASVTKAVRKSVFSTLAEWLTPTSKSEKQTENSVEGTGTVISQPSITASDPTTNAGDTPTSYYISGGVTRTFKVDNQTSNDFRINTYAPMVYSANPTMLSADSANFFLVVPAGTSRTIYVSTSGTASHSISRSNLEIVPSNPSTKPSINFIYPNKGENYAQNQPIEVRWDSTGLTKDNLIKIRLGTKPGKEEGVVLGQFDPTTGSGKISANAVPGKYFINLAVYTTRDANKPDIFLSDSSDNPITIGSTTSTNQSTPVSITADKYSVNSGETVTLNLKRPSDAKSAYVDFYCPPGISIKTSVTGLNICNTRPRISPPESYSIMLYSTTTQIQTAKIYYDVTLSDGSFVQPSVQIEVKPTLSRPTITNVISKGDVSIDNKFYAGNDVLITGKYLPSNGIVRIGDTKIQLYGDGTPRSEILFRVPPTITPGTYTLYIDGPALVTNKVQVTVLPKPTTTTSPAPTASPTASPTLNPTTLSKTIQLGQSISQVFVVENIPTEKKGTWNSWNVVKGDLPNGVSLRQYGAFSGSVSGTPTTPGTYNFMIQGHNTTDNLVAYAWVYLTITSATPSQSTPPIPTQSPATYYSPAPTPVTSTPATNTGTPNLTAGSVSVSGKSTGVANQIEAGNMTISGTVTNSGSASAPASSASFEYSTDNSYFYPFATASVSSIAQGSSQQVSHTWTGGQGTYYFRLALPNGTKSSAVRMDIVAPNTSSSAPASSASPSPSPSSVSQTGGKTVLAAVLYSIGDFVDALFVR